MDKKFCSNCGKELTEDAKFCFNCGEKFDIDDEIINSEKTTKQCIWCKQSINIGATVCPFCRRNPNSKIGDRLALLIVALILAFGFPIIIFYVG